jgi:mannose-1-phosphate guanylyltransferase
MLDHYYAIIMAGGGGTRLWPLSRQARPKQLLHLMDEGSLFQIAVNRLNGILPLERIFVVTVADLTPELKAQCPAIPDENFIIEPMPRGTASVVGLGAVALQHHDPQAVIAVLTADHFIGNVERYHQLLSAAYLAAQDDYLVTLGIAPNRPATGYGYIQTGEHLGGYGGLEVFRVLRFKEKPNETQARAMLASGDHAWNSGMFVWKTQNILAEFERQMPELAAQLSTIAAGWGTPQETDIISHIWPTIQPQTIDYGIMEGARQVVVIPAPELDWKDVGTWDSLFEVISPNKDGNIVIGGQHIGLDTRGSLVYMNQEHRLIVTIGVEDLVVVDTGDVLLVCRKDQAQKVRQVVSQLKESNHQSYV